jgi:hypothetical protein
VIGKVLVDRLEGVPEVVARDVSTPFTLGSVLLARAHVRAR